MLSLFRGTAVLIRRLGYAVIAICLFLSSAAIGAAYRDAHPNAEWKRQLAETFSYSVHGIASVASTLPQTLSALPDDLRQFFREIRGNEAGNKLAAKKTDPSKSGDETGPAVVPVSAPVTPAEERGDPLRWLNETDCGKLRAGMNERYGSRLNVEEISDRMLREEFRHVAAETCSIEKNAACSFEWCSHAKAEPVEAIPQQAALPGEDSAKTQRAQFQPAPAPVSAAAVTKVRSGGESVPRPRTLSGMLVAKRAAVIPSDDSLVKTEIPEPSLGRLSFPKESNDEPDDYRLILRRGEAARNSFNRSTGQ